MLLTGTNLSWKIRIQEHFAAENLQKKTNKSNNSNNIRPHQNVTDSYKQSVEPLNKPQDTQNIKRYKDNKLWRKLFYRH